MQPGASCGVRRQIHTRPAPQTPTGFAAGRATEEENTMSWLEKLLPAKIQQTDPTERRQVPEGLWIKCPSCETTEYVVLSSTGETVGTIAGAAGGAAAGYGGAAGGAATGAAIGSAFFHGIGTVVGAVAGGIMGALTGAGVGGAIGNKVGEQIDKARKSFVCNKCKTQISG